MYSEEEEGQGCVVKRFGPRGVLSGLVLFRWCSLGVLLCAPRLVGEIAFVGRFFPATGFVLLGLGLCQPAQYAYIRHDPNEAWHDGPERDDGCNGSRPASLRAYGSPLPWRFLLLIGPRLR